METEFNTIALIGKPDHEGANQTLVALYNYIVGLGLKVVLERRVGEQLRLDQAELLEMVELGERADLAIVVGGDGNMLGAARVLARFDVAVVGVNRGNLGFLTDLSPDSFEQPLERLLIDTTGLVLITNDGDWSHKITSPKKNKFKTYLVETQEPITDDALQQLRDGVQLHNEKDLTRPAIAERLGNYGLRLSISEGKYHQVKRMLAAVDNKVVELHREQIVVTGRPISTMSGGTGPASGSLSRSSMNGPTASGPPWLAAQAAA